MSVRRVIRPLGLILSGLLAVAVLALVPASAQAHIPAPTGLSPKGTIASNVPTFTWGRVPDATVYELQISVGDALPFLSTSTYNDRWVPAQPLAPGDYTWQVRADTQAGNSSWVTGSFTVSPTAAPNPVSPVNGAASGSPSQPTLLTWSAVAGATGYQVQVADSPAHLSTAPIVEPKGTSYALTAAQAAGTWYWSVRADLGKDWATGAEIYTDWSAAASYAVGPLADPVPGTDMSSGSQTDVSIDWQPVTGAASYELQVGKDVGFNTLVDDQIVFGTRFQPNLTYGNGTYYWRVRAIDAAGNRMPWTTSAPFTFDRSWTQVPTLTWPTNQTATPVNDPLYFQWSPVPHATSYQLDISTSSTFSTQPITCYTAATTYVTGSPANQAGSCGELPQGQTLYWRVRALDAPVNVLGVYSATSSFVYDKGAVVLDKPLAGASVDVPSLSWEPTREASAYKVTIKDKDGQTAASTTTSSTSWTPDATLDPAGNPYTWTVVSVDAAGATSPAAAGRQFTVTGNDPPNPGALPALTALSGDGSTSTDFPALSWVPVTGADHYGITLQPDGSTSPDPAGTSYITSASYDYPAATDTGTHYLAPGVYDWTVTAYDATNAVMASSPSSTFTIASLHDAAGQRVSLSGKAAQAGAGCAFSLSNSNPAQQICSVPATPTLSWSPVTGAAGYQVYLANERSITNLVTAVATTTNTMWRPPSELADNTAGGSYYWYIRPCKSLSPLVCNADPSSVQDKATNAFRKQSLPVSLQTPANGATVHSPPANAPLFTWTDYLTTNQANTVVDGAGQAGSYLSARTYRIQISKSSDFSTLLDSREVDQPFYSPSADSLPEGTIYWRVQATDAYPNNLAWSSTYSFTNAAPVVDLTSSGTTPAAGQSVSGSVPFSWNPVAGAASYTLEVYHGDSGGHASGNLVTSKVLTTQQPDYTLPMYLPPSSTAYTWRVMWTDADGQARGWSADGRFFVKSSTVTLGSPAAAALQRFNDVYLTWKPVPRAAAYRLEVRNGDNFGVYDQTVATTSFAPWFLQNGSYKWRVSALDPSAGVMGVTAWRTFRIDATAPTVLRATPSSTGHPKSHLVVRFSEKVSGVTAKSFQLHMWGKKAKVHAKVRLSKDGRVATLIPRGRLKKGHGYTGTLTQAIHDPSGNHMVTWSWSFQV